MLVKITCPVCWGVEYTDCISAEEYDSPNECPEYGTKQSDGEVPVMQELWGIRSTPSLPSLLIPLWSVMGQIELNCVLEIELF